MVALTMLNLAIVCTLRGLPIMAEEGLSLVFYFIASAVLFLVPVSLVSAELATGWPPKGPGGVYIWVNEAFGSRWGFLAMWLQWVQNVVWFPTILSFIAATLAYLYKPALADNNLYMLIVVLIAYWGGTVINFRGMEASGILSIVCVVAGTIVPGLLIVALGAGWILSGHPSTVQLTAHALAPDLGNLHSIVFLAGAVLMFSGIEVSAVHSQDVRDPKRTFPRAILLAAVVAVVLLALGSLSIAVVVPQKELSLVAGVMEAFQIFFGTHGLSWLVPLMALFIVAGSVGELSAWILGPAKGLMITARHGCLPPFLKKTNAMGVPTNVMIVQGIIATAVTLIFLFMPSVSSSYWILTALSVILYLLMYLLLYASAIKLRYSQPDVPRAYRIPFGNVGMWVVGGIGIAGALLTLAVSFLPPSQIATGSTFFYEAFLIVGTLATCASSFVILALRKPHWGAPPFENARKEG